MNQFESFYRDKLDTRQTNAEKVGWKNPTAQHVRFEQLFKLIEVHQPFSINDLGCGLADYYEFLDSKNLQFRYHGYDVMTDMIEQAKKRLHERSNAQLSLIKEASEIQLNDFTIASGIFNIRFANSDEDWQRNIVATLSSINQKSKFGFAFNMLSLYSDEPMRKSELYYGDPLFFFDYCKRNFSVNVSLLHDYGQYDFTIIVKK